MERLALALVALGHEVSAYTGRDGATHAEWCGVKIVRLPMHISGKPSVFTASFLATIHSLFVPYDIIHYHSVIPSAWIGLARFFSRLPKVVATLHGDSYRGSERGMLARLIGYLLEKNMVEKADRVIVPTLRLRERLEKNFHREVSVLPDGVESKRFRSGVLPYELRSKRYIVTEAVLQKESDTHYLIRAFLELEDTGKLPNAFKLVVILPSLTRNSYLKYLEALVANRESVVVVAKLSPKEKEFLTAEALLSVKTGSRHEELNTLLDELSLGTLLVLPRPTVLPEESHILTYPAQNIVALKKVLALYINRPEKVAARALMLQAWLEDEHSLRATAEHLVSLYRETEHAKVPKKNFVFHSDHVA